MFCSMPIPLAATEPQNVVKCAEDVYPTIKFSQIIHLRLCICRKLNYYLSKITEVICNYSKNVGLNDIAEKTHHNIRVSYQLISIMFD